MEKLTQKQDHFYILKSKSDKTPIHCPVLKTGKQYLIGRENGADVIIPVETISGIHAVLEVTYQGIRIYDMNSTNHTFVNDEKVIAKDIKIGDTIRFGNSAFVLSEYVDQADLPPALDILEAKSGKASVVNELPPKLDLPSESKEIKKEEGPRVVYPLAADPKSEYSEYIFEDKNTIYPIFKYEMGKQAVEIIILFKDSIFSVDYLPDMDGIYHMVGAYPDKSQVEFPYLGAKDKIPVVEISGGKISVYKLSGYNVTHLADKNLATPKGDVINLGNNDIVKQQLKDLEIYIRKVAAPPKVDYAPLFKKDDDLKKYILLVLFLIVFPLIVFTMWKGEEIAEEEKKKDPEPERIATILYKQKLYLSKNQAIEKTENAPERVQKAPVSKVSEKPQPIKEAGDVKQPTPNKLDPGSKTAETKQIVKKGNPKAAPVQAGPRSTQAGTPKVAAPSANTQFSQSNQPLRGTVDVFKSDDFKGAISSIMAKGGTLQGARVAGSNSGSASGEVASANIGGSTGNIKSANVAGDVGSLTGATVGVIGTSAGAEGLSAKTGVYTVGIPSETVVLGSMDPDVIRRILRDHIGQFRYCYQKELDASGNRSMQGLIKLDFVIGATGNVTNASVDDSSNLPGNVKRCVVNVLRGIRFPAPESGGTVEVRQPFNFYPKNM